MHMKPKCLGFMEVIFGIKNIRESFANLQQLRSAQSAQLIPPSSAFTDIGRQTDKSKTKP